LQAEHQKLETDLAKTIDSLDWENLARENIRLEMDEFKREIERQELIIKQQ